ncbi:hypothetical protein GGS23DRAFT_607060 [Durotheca rogersii]|uniref:uncharacterized protein n=1 Tax=Durotheca rogersii TaxID=419775 RepID=UPI00221EA8B7|nr:uncharacterized protein GGS23DRAFT_607060 [Durotheca rogersii]KAI5860053.1 hypothetical protein GGS23DRAFT_607060 [Durotheca rogersii]
MDNLNVVGHKDGSSGGWKLAAKVNCIILVVMSIVLISCLIVATSHNGGSTQKVLFFYDGDCDEGNVSKVNTALHLLINIVSTLMVTSSNFFMQVLNSPTREEIDRAHLRQSWLGIGVPSVTNAFLVSKFKTWCWVLLLSTTIPIHLVFNSAIFETDRRESDFHLTIATEQFVKGGPFYPPGASLFPAGFYYPYFGLPAELTYYVDPDSEAVKNISATALNAGQWKRLEIRECMQEYVYCRGLKHHRSLVLVIDKPDGWLRDDMWHLQDNESDFWTRYVPPDRRNHLFFDTQCRLTSGLQPGTFDLSVKYCLAEPLERICHVALSPILLLSVTLCVILKTCVAILAMIVLSRNNQAPLVTLGDALESFIERPDSATAGMCTAHQADIRWAKKGVKVTLSGPKRWRSLRNKWRASVVPISVWVTSYALFTIAIAVCVFLLCMGLSSDPFYGTFFASENNPFIKYNFSLVEGVLTANSPQLLLSVCYLAYNNMFTRLQMAREWSLFSEGYHSLRVTDPKGGQYCTYRLQLPYKYSVPLILVSIFLHWLLSNTLYLFISTGGYFGAGEFLSGAQPDPSLPPDTAVALGYSKWSLTVVLVVSCVLVLIPIVLSMKPLSPDIVIVGSNSLALSAACHVSRLSYAASAVTGTHDSPLLAKHANSPTSSRFDLLPTVRSPEYDADRNVGGDNIDLRDLTTTEFGNGERSSLSLRRLLPDGSQTERDGEGDGDGDEADEPRPQWQRENTSDNSPFSSLAQSKIRWGVVQMPPEWHAWYGDENRAIGHLGFGVEEDDVPPPVDGRLYA